MSSDLHQSILLRSGDRTAAMRRLVGVLDHLPADKSFWVDIRRHKPTRSQPQNRYLWGVVYPAILRAGGETLAGWTNDDLHEYLLGEHFGWETMTGFGRKRVRPIRRSSKLSKLEFVDYIAFIQQRMAEHGIFVPDPDGGGL